MTKSWIKKIQFAMFICICLCFLTGCANKEENTKTDNQTQNQSSSEAQKLSSQTNSTQENPPTNESVKKENMTSGDNLSNQQEEKELASAQTKIYTKEKERQNNISITISTLNDTTIEPGETFSFTQTVGKATEEKGYQEADIFDKDGNKIKGLGGGNCQVSTTLYQAVKKVDGLSITEKHEHSNDVPYAKKGNDAAVAYGSIDFKFKNNTENRIKIHAENTKDNITVTLYQIP